MNTLDHFPENDFVQSHFSMLVAFTALERDMLITQNTGNPQVKKRLKHVDFMLDEYAIRILERQPVFEC